METGFLLDSIGSASKKVNRAPNSDFLAPGTRKTDEGKKNRAFAAESGRFAAPEDGLDGVRPFRTVVATKAGHGMSRSERVRKIQD